MGASFQSYSQNSGEGDVAEALRPIYLDYLERHGTG